MQGYITDVNENTGHVLIFNGETTYKHDRIPGAAVGLKVVFQIEHDYDLGVYAYGALILADQSTNVILQQLNEIKADLARLLDFEIADDELQEMKDGA